MKAKVTLTSIPAMLLASSTLPTVQYLRQGSGIEGNHSTLVPACVNQHVAAYTNAEGHGGSTRSLTAGNACSSWASVNLAQYISTPFELVLLTCTGIHCPPPFTFLLV